MYVVMKGDKGGINKGAVTVHFMMESVDLPERTGKQRKPSYTYNLFRSGYEPRAFGNKLGMLATISTNYKAV
jgi:hypothetical protein